MSMEYQVWLMSRLSQWLDAGIGAEALNESVIEQFVAAFRAAGQVRGRSMPAFMPMLSWLRRDGVVARPVVPASDALDVLMERYHVWMVDDRGLASRTIGRYEINARRFLRWRSPASAAACLDGLRGRT